MVVVTHLHKVVLLPLPRRLATPEEEEEDVAALGRRLEALRVKPSFSPIFFQPLLCAATARCRPPGDELNAQSEVVGGVVGGVMGSLVAGELPSLSSVRPSNSRLWLVRLLVVV